MTVCPGQRRPDSMGVKTYLQFSIPFFLSWQPAKSRTGTSNFNFKLNLNGKGEGLAFIQTFSALAMAMVAPVKRMSGVIGVFLHVRCIPQQNSH